MNEFLAASELDESAIDRASASSLELEHAVAVELQAATFRWSESTSPIGPLTLAIPTGSLVAIVGEVGAGKSTLLMALLGEVPKQSGLARVTGSCVFSQQQAWIANATVRENILFGRAYDILRYDDCVRRCELMPDFNVLPGNAPPLSFFFH